MLISKNNRIDDTKQCHNNSIATLCFTLFLSLSHQYTVLASDEESAENSLSLEQPDA